MNKTDVVGYARLSEAIEGGGSIPSQKKRISEYCERYNLNLLQIFVDDGKSGWTFDRPGFISLEQFCKKNKQVRLLIIPHFDRFSRADPIDAMVKDRYFRDKLGVKVLQLSEPPDTDTNNSTYQIIRFMQAFAANEERNRIVDRVITGIHYKLMQGRYCNHAPFGYKNAKDDQGRSIIILDEPKAEIVKFIFKQYLAGYSIEQVRSQSAKKGFGKKGNSAIQRILSTSTYAGLLSVPAYKSQPAKIVKGIHPPIITENQYWKAQEKLTAKKFIPMKRPEVPLRGVLKCFHCHKLLTAAPSKGKSGKYYWYYFCNEHRKENFSAEKIHEKLFKILDAFSINEAELTTLKEKLSNAIQTQINTQTKELMKVNLGILATEKTIDDIEERHLLTPVSSATYLRVIGEKNLYLTDLKAKKETLSTGAHIYLTRLETVLSKITNLTKLYKSMDLAKQQSFIKQMFGWNLIYHSGSYRTPFIHPLFFLKVNTIEGLPLIIERKNPPDSGSENSSGPDGNVTEQDFLESVFAVFAA